MNSYLFEMSKRDERLINIGHMLFALLSFSYLGLQIYEREIKETPKLEQNSSDTVSKQRTFSAQAAGKEQSSRYSIKLQ